MESLFKLLHSSMQLLHDRVWVSDKLGDVAGFTMSFTGRTVGYFQIALIFVNPFER